MLLSHVKKTFSNWQHANAVVNVIIELTLCALVFWPIAWFIGYLTYCFIKNS